MTNTLSLDELLVIWPSARGRPPSGSALQAVTVASLVDLPPQPRATMVRSAAIAVPSSRLDTVLSLLGRRISPVPRKGETNPAGDVVRAGGDVEALGLQPRPVAGAHVAAVV